MTTLLVLPSTPQCPAAAGIGGACASQQGVICRVMQRDYADDPGLGMSAGQTGFVHNEADGGVYLNLKSDPATVAAFCHGKDLPVLHDERRPAGRAHYSYCPVWVAEKERIAAGRESLLEQPEPEPVAAGVVATDYDGADPFEAARRDLDLLAS